MNLRKGRSFVGLASSARNRRIGCALLALGLLVAPCFAGPAVASPIRYTFTYTEVGSFGVPSFDFSFVLPDYVTTTGMFALPVPFSMPTGGAPGVNTITHAGTNAAGAWAFGNASEFVGDPLVVLNFADGVAVAFLGAAPAGYVVTPGTVTFATVMGATEAIAGQLTYGGVGTLLVEDLGQVPEPASLLLLGVGLCGVATRRTQRRVSA